MQNTSKKFISVYSIMLYPPLPNKGGISVNTQDYKSLSVGAFLTDAIIDFYIK